MERVSAVVDKAQLFGNTTCLAGVLSLPAAGVDPDAVAVVILNAGILHHVGPNRMNVRVARQLAAGGYASLRFDLAGIGDSPPRTDGRDLADGVTADIRAAIDHLADAVGASRFVVFGLCAGADNALGAAAEDRRVVGAVMIDSHVPRTPGWYVRQYGRVLERKTWRKVLSGQSWVIGGLKARLQDAGDQDVPALDSAEPQYYRSGTLDTGCIRRRYACALARDVQLLQIFTGSWQVLVNYEGQLQDAFGGLSFSGRLRSRMNLELDHIFTKPAHQEWLRRELLSWLHSAPFGSGK